MTGRSPSDPVVRIPLVIGNRAINLDKGCADYLNTSVTTVTSMLHKNGYRVGHFGKWYIFLLLMWTNSPSSHALLGRLPRLALHTLLPISRPCAHPALSQAPG